MSDKVYLPGKIASSAVNQYHFVKDATAPDVALSTTGTIALGVAENEAADNAEVKICMIGLTKLVVDANSPNIGIGDPIKPGTTAGHGVKAATDKNVYSAIALEAATADAVIIDVLMVGPAYVAA